MRLVDPFHFLVFAIAVALISAFINGFHDAANSIATVVSTRVLSPGVAVVWAALFNFAAAFVVGTAVAKTIGKGLIVPSVVDPHLILSALLGAIVWNIITWYVGLPSSSSHALMGGLGGAALAQGGGPPPPPTPREPRAQGRPRRRGHRQGWVPRAPARRLGQADPFYLHLAAAGDGA